MPLYYGKTADGSDMKEFEGMHVSSCGNYWSSEPFTPEMEERLRKMDEDNIGGEYMKTLSPMMPMFETRFRKKKSCEGHEYTKREDGKWLCRHCERNMKE